MKKISKFLMLLFIITLTFPNLYLFSAENESSSAVNFFVTPLRYELKLDPGEKTTKTIKLVNLGNSQAIITTGKTNTLVEQDTGNPIFVDIGNPNQELANRITLKTDMFTIESGESEYVVEFDIDVPYNAIPGGHYGAVFFHFDSALNSTLQSEGGGSVSIDANYYVLLLVQVNGDINDNGKASDTIISPGTGWGVGGGTNRLETPPTNKIDKCPYGDFSKSNVDGKCIDEITLQDLIDYLKNKGTLDIETDSDDNGEFEIDFSVPFQNDGNTHIKPTGKITLIDEDGNVIKQIGTEHILNEEGAIIGEKIVDYLPINQEEANILPNTQKIFYQKWKGFPYEDYDENGKKIVKYWTPSDYYSAKYRNTLNILYPWQRIYDSLEQKKIRVITEISYVNNNGELVEFNSAKEIYVEYKTKRIQYDLYFFLVLAFFIFVLWFILFIIKRSTKKKCIKCKKYIRKKLEICPYCGTKQLEDTKNERTKVSKSSAKSKTNILKTKPNTKPTSKVTPKANTKPIVKTTPKAKPKTTSKTQKPKK